VKEQMTIEEARAFVESVPWRWVKGTPEGPENKPPDPHQYVILGWPGVPADELWRFVAHPLPRRCVKSRCWRLTLLRTFRFAGPFLDAGGGTRTPDTRIMIPLL
jgi:hypothetical protein